MSLPERIRTWLNEETTVWAREGLIGEAQRERILARYPDEASGGRMSFVLRTLGVVVLFASLLLVISHNWESLGRTGRMGAVTGVLVLLQGIALAYFLRGRQTGSLLGHLASCLGFGAAIITTGQVFHLDNHAPDAVLAWALGILPIVLLLRSASLHILYLILAATWYGMEMGISQQPPALGYLALIAPTAWVAYFRRPTNVGGIRFLEVADAALVSAVAWSVAYLLLLLCISYRTLPAAVISLPLALAALHAPGDPRARGWRFVGMIALAGQFLALGDLDDIARNVCDTANRGYFLPWDILPWLSYPTAALVLFALWVRRSGTGRAEAVLAAAGIAIGLLPRIGLPEPIAQSLLVASANVAALGMAAYLMHLGLSEGRLRPYTYGAVLFFVWLGWRYADYQEALGYLGMAAVFAAIGAGLFVLARVWRNRKSTPVTERIPEMPVDPLASLYERALQQARPLLITTHVAQLAVIGWMVWHHFEPIRHGQRLLVRVEPVDPRDLLRGDYVTLQYDFSVLENRARTRLANQLEARQPGAEPDRRIEYTSNIPEGLKVYLPLKVGTDGVALAAGPPSLQPPSEGPFLAGKTDGFRQLRFGIENFYVPEGTGPKWEKMRNEGDLLAEIALLPDGRAGLIELRPDPSPKVAVAARQLRGWSIRSGGYRSEATVIETREAFERVLEPVTKTVNGTTVIDQPDFTKERIVYLRLAREARLTEAIGSSHRVRITTQRVTDAPLTDDLVVAIPRDERVVWVLGERAETVEADEER
jgi:uncharacterized membrane-anchored protein